MEMDTRKKTISKNFYDDEIREVLSDGSIYLKTGVRRQPKYRFDVERDEYEAQYFNPWVAKRDYIERMEKLKEDENEWN